MKNGRKVARKERRAKRNGAKVNSNGRRDRASSARGLYQPKTELETATQRYVDLYDFAPIAYISFDRAGRIEEANLVASELLSEPRDVLIGRPFAFYVADLNSFLKHLLLCRNSQQEVKTELLLKNKQRQQIPAVLLSTPVTSTTRNGALLYQTAIIDLRQLKTAEAKLRTSEQRYKTLFDLVPVAVYTCNADGVITEFNRRAAELWGREPRRNGSEPGFRAFDKIYYPDGRPMPREERPMARVLRGEKLKQEELEIVVERPDGQRRHVIAAPQIVKDERGKILGAINCLYDFTERKHAEADAVRLAAVVQSSHDAIVGKTVKGIITDWNQGAERIFGYRPKEIIGKSILTLIPRERRFEEKEILRRICSGQSIDHYETIRRCKDGTLIDVSLTISPIKDRKGKIIGVSKIARDITPQKKVEQRLAEQARLLDLSTDAIIVRDAEDRITYWNKGATKIYGYTREEALGKVTHDLLKTKHPEPLPKIYEKLLRDDRWEGEIVHTRRDGKCLTVFSRWVLDRDAQGNRANVLETNNDITRRKEAEAALQKSKELLERRVRERTRELQAANKVLEDEIVRRKGLEGEILSVSDREQQRLGQELHDGLCQHLTAVAFMARSVATRLRNHRVIDAADIEKIAQLVNDAASDTRDLSRALHRIDVDSAGLVAALQDLVEREIWKTPCRLEVKPSFRLEHDAAAAHLFRIAREAVINANKHAQAREIVVKLERAGKEMVLRVTDDGVGVPNERELRRGLGLHIMNYRAQLMGARLEIDSPKRGGTCVSCYLPDGPTEPRKLQGNGEAKHLAMTSRTVAATANRKFRHLTHRRATNR
jgi:PAS domain S-box-containing protein